MYMGAAEDEGRNSDPAVAMAKMQLAKAAGFDTIRITAIWEPGQTAVPADQLAALAGDQRRRATSSASASSRQS